MQRGGGDEGGERREKGGGTAFNTRTYMDRKHGRRENTDKNELWEAAES